MSERLEATEDDNLLEEGSTETWASSTETWATGEHYSRMNIEAGSVGDAMYFHIPPFTILTKTQEELETVNNDFAVLLSKYTDQIIVGTPHEASLILSLNQAAADLAVQNDVINTLRNKIYELTGSYDEAGDWGDKD